MTYTPDSPAVIWAERIYSLTSGHTEALTAILTHHKRKLQGKLRQAQDLAAAEGREVVRLRAERDTWRTKAQSAEADAAAQTPVTLPEITDDDITAGAIAYMCHYAHNTGRVKPDRYDRSMIEAVLTAYRDRLADSLPQWQPIEPGDIKPGMLVRGTDCGYLVEGSVTEVASGWIGTSDASWITEGRTWEVDPRTVPADPDAAAVEAMARAVCGDWDALPDGDRDEVRTEMRAALTAYRAHVEKEA